MKRETSRNAAPEARDGHLAGRPIVVAHFAHCDAAHVPTRPVTHSFAALAFYTRGRARVEQNGQWNLAAGDLYLIPAGEPHRMVERETPEFWGLSFCVSCFAADAATTALLEPFERVRDGAAAIVQVAPERRELVTTLFAELEQVGRDRAGPCDVLDAVERSLLTLILNEVRRAQGSSTVHGGGGVVAEALRYIERNCLRRLTLADVAAAVQRSPTYVTSALKRATGRSVGAWIVSGRMAEARRLLLHSDEMVDVIAERVGYADATHFIRMFRREHTATPAAWRAARGAVARAPETT